MIPFSYFNQMHIGLLLLCFFLGHLVLILPKYYQTDRRKAARFIGLLILLTVGYEMYYRVTYEGFSWGQVAPLHFCSVSVIGAGLYLRTQKDQYFQVAYYFSFGAFLAMILPGIRDYHHQLYFILFMGTHYFVLFAVAYGFKWLGAKPTWEGFKYASTICLFLFMISFFWNEIYFTNFMFTKIYLLPQFRVIQPFWTYQVLLIPSFLGIMYLFYLPFRKR